METVFQEVPSQIYATYGMTETVSHIALRPIAPKKQHSLRYTTIGAITVRQDPQGCLVIDCPEVADILSIMIGASNGRDVWTISSIQQE